MGNRSKRRGFFVMHVRYTNPGSFKRIEDMNYTTTLQTKNMADTIFFRILARASESFIRAYLNSQQLYLTHTHRKKIVSHRVIPSMNQLIVHREDKCIVEIIIH